MIRSVKFVSVPVTDQALAFYTEKLGFRLATDQPFDDKQRWIELAILGAQTGVVLFRMEGGPQPGSRMNLSFWADDVEGTAQTHKNRGVHFLAEPKKESWEPQRSSKIPTAIALSSARNNVFVWCFIHR